MEIKVRYKRSLGITLVLASVAVAMDSFVVGLQGDFPFSLMSGLVTLFGGVLFLKNKYFTVSKNEFILYTLIGKVDRNYSFKSWNSLKIEDNRLYVKQDGEFEKIPVYKWLTNEADWNSLSEQLDQQHSESNYKKAPEKNSNQNS
ncbi:hypothetical protein [Baaleninema sp.]|uniref:hypothetical protein n=1 Tax=Baaleninema sp. TaxID=3101197 RepID=UPI003D087006